MQYVVMKDEETGEVQIIGRFRKLGIGEVFQDNLWQQSSDLYRLQFDCQLEEISEIEAMKIIDQKQTSELQAA